MVAAPCKMSSIGAQRRTGSVYALDIPGSIEIVKRARPTRLEQARQRAVGQYRATCLAVGAVIGFIVGIDDALHRSPAVRARFAEAAVHGHLRPERRDAFREVFARLVSQAFGPFRENGPRR